MLLNKHMLKVALLFAFFMPMLNESQEASLPFLTVLKADEGLAKLMEQIPEGEVAYLHYEAYGSSGPRSDVGVTPNAGGLLMPDILKDPSKYTAQYRSTTSTLSDNLEFYYKNFMHQYSVRFSMTYTILFYYYYDLLYDKFGLFFNKYSDKQ